ncbi:hypothetical protein RJT34_08028 [Clitoria ternatea]|uniref:DRBM domain-containing protein n=1 Tax=Clitoria ternatea TaxID=43366 RepID=A0AAN9PTU8_CLITE
MGALSLTFLSLSLSLFLAYVSSTDVRLLLLLPSGRSLSALPFGLTLAFVLSIDVRFSNHEMYLNVYKSKCLVDQNTDSSANLSIPQASSSCLKLPGLLWRISFQKLEMKYALLCLSYIDDTVGSKKDVEQSVAHATIPLILGNPNFGTMLIGINKSKSMLYDKHKGNTLQDIHANLKDVGVGNSTFWKSILHEYAVKLNLEKPAYNTVHQGSLFHVFTSSVVFNGTSYTGDPARSKTDVKQLVARATILSMMGHMF